MFIFRLRLFRALLTFMFTPGLVVGIKVVLILALLLEELIENFIVSADFGQIYNKF